MDRLNIQIIIVALVTSGNKETYIWLLEQFNDAMKGKVSCSIIINGDVAMKNVIKKVYPSAFHRLCAWNLLPNVVSNVCPYDFLPDLKRFMLSDLEIFQFENKWNEMVMKFGL